ncbi:hypothetical protein MFUM_720021 [Methylacidiphilum fumariolicum SolV]|uniref:Uncharacterized protein n=1 Tax=Methylacidiphilum fumariolicum (strain SolV) TaxID=1156937 RepID=I0JZI7_METFB|nr:hypothetical protein MFUM_720021 [Methylacidiphilum fumariolicum SolV]
MPPELGNTHVGNGPSQGIVLQPPAHFQVFDNNGMKPLDKVGGELVSGVLLDIGDAGEEPG